jgi:UTP:GlnB (protein PII) uridylyltransferase
MKIIIALLLSLLISTPLAAQQTLTVQEQRQINISRKLINDKRNTAIAYNMKFTQEEKEKFWPLYREYRDAMAKVGDKRMAVIVEYAEHLETMSESKAKELLDRSFAVQKETLKVRQKYAGKFRRILPATKVVRLMQIEHRMDTQVDMKIAEGVPLME